jgi:hypothetical protein
MSPLRSWQREIDIQQHEAHTAKVASMTTFVRECLKGDVTLCRVPSTVDTPDTYAGAVAVAYDADSLELISDIDLALIKRIAREEFSAWRRESRTERVDVAERLHDPLFRFGGAR